MSSSKVEHCIKPITRNSKNFVYKGKKYPINFDSVKNNSNYFYNNRKDFKNKENIELQIKIDINDDSIQSFINCCHNQSFEINDTNIFSLNYLATEYEVPELINITQDYLSKFHSKLILPSILYKQELLIQKNSPLQGEFSIPDTTKEEEILADHFIEYFNDERLLNLPISVIDRILKGYLAKKSKSEIDMNKVIEFLFKCLDKLGRKSSVLFLNIDFDNQPKDFIVRLMNDYSNSFDFNMINVKSILNTSSELLKELSKVKIEFSEKISQMNQIIDEQKNQISEFNKARILIENDFKKLIDEQNKIIEDQKKMIIEFKSKSIEQTSGFVTKQIFLKIKLIKFFQIILCDF